MSVGVWRLSLFLLSLLPLFLPFPTVIPHFDDVMPFFTLAYLFVLSLNILRFFRSLSCLFCLSLLSYTSHKINANTLLDLYASYIRSTP